MTVRNSTKQELLKELEATKRSLRSQKGATTRAKREAEKAKAEARVAQARLDGESDDFVMTPQEAQIDAIVASLGSRGRDANDDQPVVIDLRDNIVDDVDENVPAPVPLPPAEEQRGWFARAMAWLRGETPSNARLVGDQQPNGGWFGPVLDRRDRQVATATIVRRGTEPDPIDQDDLIDGDGDDPSQPPPGGDPPDGGDPPSGDDPPTGGPADGYTPPPRLASSSVEERNRELRKQRRLEWPGRIIVTLIGIAVIVGLWGFFTSIIPDIIEDFGSGSESATTQIASASLAPGTTQAPTTTQAEEETSLPETVEDESDEVMSGADALDDPRTPAVLAEIGPVQSWTALVAAIEGSDLAWYHEAVDSFEEETSWEWAEVKRWARAEADGFPTRLGHVFGDENVSDAEARDLVADMVDDPDSLEELEIVRPSDREAGHLVNTRRLSDAERMSPFRDNRSMVRVSLAPVIFDDDGEPVGLRNDSGIFADCLNLWWWQPEVGGVVVTTTTSPPATVPPTSPPTTAPPVTVPPTTVTTVPETTTTTVPETTTTTVPETTTTTVPETTTTLAPKDPSEDILVNPDVPPPVLGPGTTPVGEDPGTPDPVETHDPTDPDVADDGYCQTCEEPTFPPPPPPEEVVSSTTTTTLPPQADPGEGQPDPEDPNQDPLPEGGDEGISDPEPVPEPEPEPEPSPEPPPEEEGDPCVADPSLFFCE